MRGARIGVIRRGGGRRRVVARIAVALVAVAGVVAVGLWAGRDRLVASLRATAEMRIGQALGGTVRIGALAVDPLRLTATASDVDVTVPAGEAPPLTIYVARLRVRVAWLGLASAPGGTIRLRELDAEQPIVHLDSAFLAARAEARRTRPPRPFVLRVDRLELRGGTLVYDDRPLPLSLRSDEVGISGEWDRVRRAIAGRASGRLYVEAGLLARAVPVDVRSRFRFSPHRVEWSETTAEGAGVSLSGSGHAVVGAGALAVVAEGTMRADLDLLGPFLSPTLPPVSGRISGPFRLQRGEGPLRLTGRWEGIGARLGPFAATTAAADVEYRERQLRLERLEATALGGIVRGTVGVRFGEAARFDVALAGERLDVGDALDLVRSRVPFAGSATGTMRLAGEVDRRRSWNGSGSFSVASVPAPADRVPARGDVRLEIASGAIAVSSEALEAGAATLAARLDLDLAGDRGEGRLEIRGATRSAGATRDGVVTILEALAIVPPEIVREEIAGTGEVGADIRFGPDGGADLTLDLRDGSWAGQSFRRAELDLGLAGSRLEVRRLRVDSTTGKLEAQALARIDPLALESLDLRAADLEASVIGRRFAPALDVVGALSGSLSLAGGPERLAGTGRIVLVEGRLEGEVVDRLEARLEVAQERVRLADVVLRGAAGEIRGEGTIGAWGEWVEWTVTSSRLALEQLALVRSRKIPLAGVASVRGTVRQDARGTTGRLEGSAIGTTLAGLGLGDLRVGANFTGPALALEIAPEEGASWRIGGEIGLSAELPARLTLSMDRAYLDLPLGVAPGTTWAIASGTVELGGPLARPEELAGSGRIESLELHFGEVVARAAEALPLLLEASVVTVGPVRLVGEGSELAASLRWELAGGGIAGRCAGRVDLGSAAALFAGIRAVGAADVSLEVAGTIDRPLWSGALGVRGGRVRAPALLREPIEEIDLSLVLREREAVVERLTAVLGGGEVSAQGRVALEGTRPGGFELGLDLSEVRLAFPEGFRGVYSGSLYLQGEGTNALLGGKLALLRGLYDREFSTALVGPKVRLESPGGTAGDTHLYLNLDLAGTDGVWLRNDSARVETQVDLHVGGELRRPEVTGRIRALEGGVVRLRDVDYRILSGSLDFVDLDRINPFVDVKAETRVREYDVSLSIEGTADKFEYRLSSNPSLATQDIIALLTTGSTLVESSAGGATLRGSGITGDLAADYVVGALTGNLERRLKKSLGLERVRIDPLFAQQGADPTARITVGKRVSDSVLLVYSTDLDSTENQYYRAEWEATRTLRLSAERDATGGVGGEIGFTTRLGRGGSSVSASRAPDEVAPAGSPPGPTVAEVVVEGIERTSEADLLGALANRPGVVLRGASLFADEEAIRARLLREGRIEARVDAAIEPLAGSGDRVRVRFRVRPGPRVDFRVEGPKRRERARLEKLLEGLWAESRFTEELYADAEELLRGDLADRGYYTAEVSHVSRSEGDARIVRFFVDPGSPVTVARVRLDGVEETFANRLSEALETRAGGTVTRKALRPAALEADRETLAALCHEHGFLRARVEAARVVLSPDGRSADVTFPIDSGPRFIVRGVESEAVGSFDADRLVAWSGLRAGEPYASTRVLEAERAIRQKLDEAGYPDVRVATTVVVGEAEGVTVKLLPDAGSRKTVGSVAIAVGGLTKEKIVRRELLLAPGDPLSREKVVASQQRLYRLGIFQNVRLDWLPMEGDAERQILSVRVEEAKPLQLGLAAGYDTEAGPRGRFSLGHDNVGGYNRSLVLHTAASDIYRRAQLLAREPRLFSRDLQALASVAWENEEKIGFTQDIRSTSLRVEKKLRSDLKGFLRYNFQRVDLEDVEDEIAVTQEKLANVRLGDVAYVIGLDRRDDPFLPRRGAYLAGEIRLFAHPFLSDSEFAKATVHGSRVRSFASGWQEATGLRLGMAIPWGSTASVPITERFFAGGDSTLRGFSRDEVGPSSDGVPTGGQALLLLNEEWRFPIWRSLKGVLFYDAGNVWRTVGSARVDDVRHVVGAGFRFETAIGPIRFEYGRKLDRKVGESTGEFFLSIGNPF